MKYNNVIITRDDYDNFLEVMDNVSKESPYMAYRLLSRAVGGKIYYSVDEMIDAHLFGYYSGDIKSMDELVDYIFTNEVPQEQIDEMTEDEIAAYKSEIRENLYGRLSMKKCYSRRKLHRLFLESEWTFQAMFANSY